MSPICARPSCMALTMSVPVSTTNILASTPCLAKKPFSAPINIGRWPKLLPITTSSLGKSAIASSVPELSSPRPIVGGASTYFIHLVCLIVRHCGSISLAQHLRIYAVWGHAPTKQRLDIVHHDVRHFLTHIEGGAAKMRIENDVFQPFQFRVYLWLMLEHIEAGAGNLPAFERAHQSGFVDNGSARGIDNKGGLLHQTKLA